MTYQLHPLPEGLHYKAFYASFSKQPMWSLCDGDGTFWVDLRSVFRVLRTTWQGRWRGYCEARQHTWGLEACADRKMLETMLAPTGRMAGILGEIETQLLKFRQETAAARTRQLRKEWRALQAHITGVDGVNELAGVKKRRPPTRRKIDAWVVRQAFSLTAKGYKKKEIAYHLNISIATLEKLAAGTYPSLDAKAEDAWWETFGTQNPSETCFTARKTNQGQAGGSAGSPAGVLPVAGVLSDPEKSEVMA